MMIVYIIMKLFGKEVPCLVDSGCDTTVVPKTLTDRYRRLGVKSSTRSIWAANNTPICVHGETEIPFVLEEHCMWTPVLISEDVEEIMLGIDWLKEHNCVWNFRTNCLTIDGRYTNTLTRKGHFRCRRVLAQEYSEIPPRSEKEVVARVTLLSGKESPKDVMIDAKRLRPGLYLARTLLSSDQNNVKVRIANTTSKPQSIPSSTCLGQAMPVTVIMENDKNSESRFQEACQPASRDQTPVDIIDPVLQKMPMDVTSSQRQQVVDFLEEFDDMFSRGTYDMGRTTLVEHSIDTGTHRPIPQPLRRHPRAHLDEIDRQVDELMQNGFVEPSASPWASNVVLVRKKDGTFRL